MTYAARSCLCILSLAPVVLLATFDTAAAQSDIAKLLRCQKTMAKAGASYANRTVKSTLKCTNEIVECQVNCDEGVYGPSCITNPPPCCDSDDPSSNEAFGDCMDEAEETCDREALKIVSAEAKKQLRITSKCDDLTEEQLCGAETPGLNFVTLNAGCEALIPGYECDLPNLLACVGGPMQQELSEQIAELLDPRAGEALSASSLSPAKFSGIARVYKIRGTLAGGKIDVYSISGEADDRIAVSVRTFDDNDNTTSNLDPILTYISADGTTPVGDTSVIAAPCSVPSTCGASCPQFKRRFPFTETFFLAVQASEAAGCGGGEYTLVVKSDGGSAPVLVGDDLDAITP